MKKKDTYDSKKEGKFSPKQNTDGTTQFRDKCEQPGCGSYGHPSSRCWKAFPHLRPVRDASQTTISTTVKPAVPKQKPGSSGPQVKHAAPAVKAPNRYVGGAAVANLEKLEHAIAKARGMASDTESDSEGMSLSPPSSMTNLTDISTQEPEADVVSCGMVTGGVWSMSNEEEEVDDHRTIDSCDKEHVQCFLANDRSTDPGSLPIVLFAAASAHLPSSTWLADSGANIHITNDKSLFVDYVELTEEVGTAGAYNNLAIAGCGKIVLPLVHPSGEVIDFGLSNVFYAPDARLNLLSISALCKKAGLKFYGDHESLSLIDPENHEELAYCPCYEGVYILQIQDTLTQAVVEEVSNETPGELITAPAVNFDHPVWLWHRRLGHISLPAMRKLLKCSTGINLTDKQILTMIRQVCPICATTRALIHIPRDPATRHAHTVGETIHVDSWGPYRMNAFDGTKYFNFFTDDATRNMWSRRLKQPGAPAAIQVVEFIKFLERQYDTKVKAIRTDNAYLVAELTIPAQRLGIELEPCAPHAHHQNGVSERQHRTLRERASAMIHDMALPARLTSIITGRADEFLRNSNMPEILWPLAMEYAVFVKNRTPAKVHKYKKTPYEALEGRMPELHRLRVFGSRTYVTYNKEKERDGPKLHKARGWVGYFVGFENESTYRIWDNEEKAIKLTPIANVEDDAGLDDPQAFPPITTSDPTPDLDIQSQISDPSVLSSDDGEDDEDAVENVQTNVHLRSRNVPLVIPDDQDEESSQYTDNAFSDQGIQRNDEETETIPEGFLRAHRHNPTTGVIKSFIKPIPIPRNLVGKVAGRVPDPNKCSNCFRHGMLCNNERPCENCQNQCLTCRDQTEADQEVIPLENRDLPPAKQIKAASNKVWKTKRYVPTPNACGPCRKNARHCNEGDPCDQCEIRGIECTARPKSRAPGVPFADKCHYCKIHASACDGKSPCATCIKIGVTCKPQKYTDIPRCHRCQTHPADCDRKENCSKCIESKSRCVHYSGDLVTKTYTDNNPKFQTDLEDDREKCEGCTNGKRICLGSSDSGPCAVCVRLYEDGKTQYTWCTYRKANNKSIAFRTAAFDLADPENPKADLFPIRNESRTFTTVSTKRSANSAGKPGHVSSRSFRTVFDPVPEDAVNTEETGTDQASAPLMSTTDWDDILGPMDFSPGSANAFFISAFAALPLPIDFAKLPNPTNEAEAMNGPEAQYFRQSRASEFASLEKNEVFEICDLPPGMKSLTTKWVDKRKLASDGSVAKYKSRLVARGFQQREGIDYNETFATVVKPVTYRLLFALTVLLGWDVQQLDVVTAFLNGELEEEVFLRPPPGISIPKGKVLRCRKALYGLKQASRSWYVKFVQKMQSIGWKVSEFDPCLFIHKDYSSFLTIHVDDIMIFGPDSGLLQSIKRELFSLFEMTDANGCEFYLGMHIEKTDTSLHIHQSKFVQELLERYGLEDIPISSAPMDKSTTLRAETEVIADPSFKTHYQSLVGSLIYLVQISRPDIAYTVSVLGRFMSNPNQSHLDAAIQVYGYLKGTPTLGPCYRVQDEAAVQAYVDADWGGCVDTGRSTTGWVFMLAGSPISWASQRQKTPALSSCEAEYMASTEATKEAIWIEGLMAELGFSDLAKSITLFVDNDSAVKLMKNAEFHARTKHINIRYHFIREAVKNNKISPTRVNSKDNVADVLTKPLTRIEHQRIVSLMGLE